ncbi:MAG: hypothetical protein WA182_13915 [Candidatus Sulfotelmatobacter sp.]
MRKSTGRAMFEAMSMMTAQQMALSNPNSPVAPKPKELSPEEVRANKKRALAAAFEKDHRDRKAKEDAEHATALENGQREDMFRAFNATTEERKALCRAKPELIPELLTDLRRPAPANMEVFEQMYSVLK